VEPVNSPRLHTQSPMFFRYTEMATLVISTSTNWLQRLGPKKVESFYVECTTKTSNARCKIAVQPMCRYSPCRHHICNDKLYSATNLLKYFVRFPSFGARWYSDILPLSLKLRWRQEEYCKQVPGGHTVLLSSVPIVHYVILSFL
jgi:hypothetical protein